MPYALITTLKTAVNKWGERGREEGRKKWRQIESGVEKERGDGGFWEGV